MYQPVRKETLNMMFENDRTHGHITFDGKCAGCGRNVSILIMRTLEGYELMGGIIYETKTHQLLSKCCHCHEKEKSVEESTLKATAGLHRYQSPIV